MFVLAGVQGGMSPDNGMPHHCSVGPRTEEAMVEIVSGQKGGSPYCRLSQESAVAASDLIKQMISHDTASRAVYVGPGPGSTRLTNSASYLWVSIRVTPLLVTLVRPLA